MSFNRRRFLQLLLGLSALAVIDQGFSLSLTKRHTRVIPSSGELLPVVGLGSWLTFGIDPGDETSLVHREKILREFLAGGGGMLDSSPMYGTSQQVIGKCLQRIAHKESLFSATKVWTTGQRNGLVQMEHSRLLWGLPRLDLMQVHNLLDWQEHLPVLYEMKEKGDIRYVGVTTSHGRRHEELAEIIKKEKLDFIQLTYNILDREAEHYLLPLAADKGIAVIVNRPFQRGGLFEHVGNHVLPGWAKELGCHSWAQVFLKFIISHPAVTCAIPATTRLEHLRENMDAAYGVLPDTTIRKKMVNFIESF